MFDLEDGPLPHGTWVIPGAPYALRYPYPEYASGLQLQLGGQPLPLGSARFLVLNGLLPSSLRYRVWNLSGELARAVGAYILRLEAAVERAGGWGAAEAAFALGGLTAVSELLGWPK